MIKLEFLSELVKLALYSAYIAGEEQPVSLLLCADAESYKSKMLARCVKIDKILYLSDATAFEILKDYGDDISEGKIRHILIPDLIPMVSKRWETSASFIAFLNMLIEEGIIESRTYALHKRFRNKVKCGIIACITPTELEDRRHKWVGTGFISRLLPISWSYSEPIRIEIFKEIISRAYRNEPLYDFELPAQDYEVELPTKLGDQLLPYTYQFAEQEKASGFRFQKHLQRLAIANAIIQKRKAVTQEDIDKIKELCRYTNFKFTAI